MMNEPEIDSFPLHSAIKKGEYDSAKELILNAKETNLDLNRETDQHITPLIEACICGSTEIVEMLLDSGCPAQPPAGFHHSPLRGATVCGHSHLIPLLLKHGADPNALSDGNRTPLMGGCFLRKDVSDAPTKSALCVKELLLDSRTDPTLVNTFGESALDLANIRGYDKSVQLVKNAVEQWNAKTNK